MAQGRRAARVTALGVTFLIAACTRSPAIDLRWVVDNGSASGNTRVRLVMRDPVRGGPVRGARLRLEGHMAHPGMGPVVSEVKETADGRYESALPLAMAGRWTLVLSGSLADGTRVTWQRQVEIAGVPPPS
jgi:hypothetical protein